MKMLYKEKLLDSSSVAALTLYDGILSDASVDAYDDTIDPFGIECPYFLIALLNHNKIGLSDVRLPHQAHRAFYFILILF